VTSSIGTCRPRERAARLDNVSPEPSGRPAHRFHQLTAKQRRLAVAKNIAEVAAKMPEKAERMRLYEEETGAHQEEIASNLVQLIEKAREMDVDASVYAGIHEAAAYGLPGPCANPDSTSARRGTLSQSSNPALRALPATILGPVGAVRSSSIVSVTGL
jgi:hypothetical protein